ncbi:hypothetical protein [Sphingomonas abietis]|uniref:Uncharacterized protein n=1 Tax=Sphingomonas abietis TaxID=3012344 RepID=A0ABY7NP03_9SPHN|nr:hypothetical protein [Sphingomonas abietis]WBO23269.1 hypothetical protein PBT88_03775 [Sphingomonas abietis]
MEIAFDPGLRCMVHVKVKADNRLGLHCETLAALEALAAARGLPLLIAWKRYSRWMLVDSTCLLHRDGMARLGHVEAARQNLLGVLAGDYAFHIEPGAGIEIALAAAAVPDHADDGTTASGLTPHILSGFGGGGRQLAAFPQHYRDMLAFVPLTPRRFADGRGAARFEAEEAIGYTHQFVVATINHGRPDPRFPHARWLRGADADAAAAPPPLDDILGALTAARRDGLIADIFHQRPFDTPAFLP